MLIDLVLDLLSDLFGRRRRRQVGHRARRKITSSAKLTSTNGMSAHLMPWLPTPA
ncbi:hypothetical protein AB0M54_41660 [Actinoplanes sp. NPDC051470]|uniref:hypothetical protein n=1 Tax=unclassified Actinoplanes TaxID=2626549 RepID=UPI00343E85E6